ncbi:MAG: ABC transporter permease [Sulfurospirillaceae bacterium]|nr:ABC transporter permease [Sulfurospirillaceae bacterium]
MLRGFKAIFYKESKQISRDHGTLFFIFLIPIFQLIVFGYAINTTVHNIPSIVLNLDRSQKSSELLWQFTNSGYFKIHQEAKSKEALLKSIVKGESKVGIIIPENYTRDLLNAHEASVQVLIDGSDSTIASQAQQAASLIGLHYGLNLKTFDTTPKAVDVRTQMLYNPESKTANFMVPGLIAIILTITTVILTSLSIVKEKEKGTLEQILVTPVEPMGLMLGKLAPFNIIAFIQVLVVVGIMNTLFAVPITGSIVLLLLMSLTYIFCMLGLGLLISTKAQNQMQAIQYAFLTMLPSILLSGFMFPRAEMPTVIYAFSYLIPATYYIDIMRGIVLRGADFMDLWEDFCALIGLGGFFVIIAAKRFKKNLE